MGQDLWVGPARRLTGGGQLIRSSKSNGQRVASSMVEQEAVGPQRAPVDSS